MIMLDKSLIYNANWMKQWKEGKVKNAECFFESQEDRCRGNCTNKDVTKNRNKQAYSQTDHRWTDRVP